MQFILDPFDCSKHRFQNKVQISFACEKWNNLSCPSMLTNYELFVEIVKDEKIAPDLFYQFFFYRIKNVCNYWNQDFHSIALEGCKILSSKRWIVFSKDYNKRSMKLICLHFHSYWWYQKGNIFQLHALKEMGFDCEHEGCVFEFHFPFSIFKTLAPELCFQFHNS